MSLMILQGPFDGIELFLLEVEQPTEWDLRVPMARQCAEEQGGKHPRHYKHQSCLHADLVFVS